jgi:hypothetical protein
MGEVCSLIWLALVGAFRSRASLEAENTICAISLTCAAAIADGIAAMDMFVVPTISFRLLCRLLIVGHGRRQILWFGVTARPTAEWIANQITEACGWEQAPRYLIRDGDAAYGESEGSDQWAFAIDRRRRALLGKMDMLKG